MNPLFENAFGGGKSEEEIKNQLFQKFLEFRIQAEQQKKSRIINDINNFSLNDESPLQKKQENLKNIQKKDDPQKVESENPNKNADYKELSVLDLVKILKEKDERITNLEVQIVVLQAEKKEFQEKSDELQSHMLFLPEAGMALRVQMEKTDKELSECRKKCEKLESDLKKYREKSELEIQQLKEKSMLEKEEKNKIMEENQKFKEKEKSQVFDEKSKSVHKPKLNSIVSEESKNEDSKAKDGGLTAKNLEILISGDQEEEFHDDPKKVGNLTSRNSLSSKDKIWIKYL